MISLAVKVELLMPMLREFPIVTEEKDVLEGRRVVGPSVKRPLQTDSPA
jgi:hypothetical protein